MVEWGSSKGDIGGTRVWDVKCTFYELGGGQMSEIESCDH